MTERSNCTKFINYRLVLLSLLFLKANGRGLLLFVGVEQVVLQLQREKVEEKNMSLYDVLGAGADSG